MARRPTKPLLFLLFSLFSLPAFSQQNFVSGYYITLQQDTVRGFIQDKNWSRNPDQFVFKTSPEAPQVQTLTAATIGGLGLSSGEVYQRALIALTPPSPVPATAAAPIRDSTAVFLRVVYRGAASLLLLKEANDKEHFFYQKQRGPVEELKYQRYVEEEGGRKSVVTSEIFKGQLFNFFADCPDLRKAISRANYKMSDLQALFRQYSQCQGTGEEVQVTKKDKVQLQFGLLGGINQTTLNFTGTEHPALTKPSFTNSLGTVFGISLNLVLPRNHQRWMLYNDLLWKPYATKATYTEIVSNDNYWVYHTTFKMNYVGLGTMLRYRFATGNYRPFVNIGLANNYCLNETNTQEAYHKFYTAERTDFGKGIEEFRRYEQAILLGGGISFKQVSAEIRGELGNGISSLGNLAAKKKIIGLLLGFHLN